MRGFNTSNAGSQSKEDQSWILDHNMGLSWNSLQHWMPCMSWKVHNFCAVWFYLGRCPFLNTGLLSSSSFPYRVFSFSKPWCYNSFWFPLSCSFIVMDQVNMAPRQLKVALPKYIRTQSPLTILTLPTTIIWSHCAPDIWRHSIKLFLVDSYLGSRCFLCL